MRQIFGYYLILINVLAIIITISDKKMAIKHKRRISEKSLISISILGGGFSMLITMLFIRHKTKKIKFMLGIPLIILLQIIIIFNLYNFGYFK